MGFETKYGLSLAPGALTGKAALAFERNTRKHLSWIEGTTVGKLLLKAIGWHARNTPGNLSGGQIQVLPYTGTGCNATVNNATSTATGWAQPVVNYSPSVFHKNGACHAQLTKTATNRGLYPDELLFHELIHALRGASARFRGTKVVDGLAHYNTREEFLAVLTTNIYISDPSNGSKTGLRKDHKGFKPLEPELSGSFEFFKSSKDAFTLIDAYCTDQPAFTKWVSEVKAPFNPLWAYYHDKVKARGLSESAAAMVRDEDWIGLLGELLTRALTPPIQPRLPNPLM